MQDRRGLVVIADDNSGEGFSASFPNAEVTVVRGADALLAMESGADIAAIVCALGDPERCLACVIGLRARKSAAPVVVLMDTMDPRDCARVLDAGAQRIFAPGDPDLVRQLRLLLGDDCC
jgi:DNA-binding NarL/FixJ family response regulator